MNREIIFRGKKCKDGRWVYGSYVESHSSWKGCKPHKSWIVPSPMTNGGWFSIRGAYPVKEETVCQYTGLQDVNNIDIYEGDIVTDFINEGKPFGVIEWHNDGYFFINVDFNKKQQYQGSFTPLGEMIRVEIDVHPLDVEVIGNIYDNLELLKGGKE